MTPLKLTLKLETPTGIGHPWINSDGLVAHLAALDEYGREYLDLIAESTINAPTDLDLNLPLKTTNGIRHASASFFDDTEKRTTKLYKRYMEGRSHMVDSRRNKIRTNSGVYKNDIIRLPYYPASECMFYFGATAPDRLQQLFNDHFSALGKKRAVGFGAVREMEWSETEEDMSVVYDGRAMRPIPAEKLSHAEQTEYVSWRPPYWADENHAECAPPGAEVEW